MRWHLSDMWDFHCSCRTDKNLRKEQPPPSTHQLLAEEMPAFSGFRVKRCKLGLRKFRMLKQVCSVLFSAKRCNFIDLKNLSMPKDGIIKPLAVRLSEMYECQKGCLRRPEILLPLPKAALTYDRAREKGKQFSQAPAGTSWNVKYSSYCLSLYLNAGQKQRKTLTAPRKEEVFLSFVRTSLAGALG